MSKNLRRNDRLPFKGRLRVSWQDESGLRRSEICNCLDASRTGLKVLAQASVPERIYVQLEGLDFKLLGAACVRHSDRERLSYCLGLEFSGGIRLVVNGEEQFIYAA